MVERKERERERDGGEERRQYQNSGFSVSTATIPNVCPGLFLGLHEGLYQIPISCRIWSQTHALDFLGLIASAASERETDDAALQGWGRHGRGIQQQQRRENCGLGSPHTNDVLIKTSAQTRSNQKQPHPPSHTTHTKHARTAVEHSSLHVCMHARCRSPAASHPVVHTHCRLQRLPALHGTPVVWK